MATWRAIKQTHRPLVGPKGELVSYPYWVIARFDDERFKNGKGVYRCDTEEDAEWAVNALNLYEESGS